MPQPCSNTAPVRGRARSLFVALALALGVLGAARWASADTLSVSDAQLQGFEFFELASCDVSDREAC